MKTPCARAASQDQTRVPQVSLSLRNLKLISSLQALCPQRSLPEKLHPADRGFTFCRRVTAILKKCTSDFSESSGLKKKKKAKRGRNERAHTGYVIAKTKAVQARQREAKMHSKPRRVSLSHQKLCTPPPKVDFPLEGFRKQQVNANTQQILRRHSEQYFLFFPVKVSICEIAV